MPQMLLFGIIALSMCVSAKPLTAQEPMWVDPATRQMRDELGREIFFHGANVVVKGYPWMPTRTNWTYDTSFVAKDMQVMQDLGLNAIRLGTMWPGAEPTEGVYNTSYITALAELVEEASTYGIVSLMDMHQDDLSEKFCGEGLPNWATITNVTNFPWPLQSTPFNVSADGVPTPYSQCWTHDWAEYYPTQALGQAFQNLYSNSYGLRDKWAAFWKTIATAMKPLGAAVLGYELLNEPWAGDMWKDILIMVPGVADEVNLAPAYEQLQASIRSVDTSHAIFFEGVTWDWFNVGFKQVPGGDDWRNKSVLSYHFYMPPDFNLEIQFGARVRDMERLGCGGMLTEFSPTKCDGCGDIVAEQVMDKCDEDLQSWLFWEFKSFVPITGASSPMFFPNGSLNVDTASKVSRTYAQAVAGRTRKMQFNHTTGKFHLRYEVTADTQSQDTVIYTSLRYHYPSGYAVRLTPDNSTLVWSNSTGNTLTVTHSTSLPAGTAITVEVTPNP